MHIMVRALMIVGIMTPFCFAQSRETRSDTDNNNTNVVTPESLTRFQETLINARDAAIEARDAATRANEAIVKLHAIRTRSYESVDQETASLPYRQRVALEKGRQRRARMELRRWLGQPGGRPNLLINVANQWDTFSSIHKKQFELLQGHRSATRRIYGSLTLPSFQTAQRASVYR